MHLLYLTFGARTEVHSQAAFSICSFLKAANQPDTIHVMTDQPSFYNHLQHLANVITLTAAELQEWEGPHHFFWRVKIKAIEKVCALYPGSPVMYLDADTFFINGLPLLSAALQQGNAFMHEDEGPLSAKKSKTEKRMWRQLQQKKYGGLTMQATDKMWNAGVVATPNTKQNKECKLALAICDDMCQQGVTRRLIEQYALSLALAQVYGLQEARPFIAHYWSAKAAWNQKIEAFFLQAYLSQWSLNQVLQYLQVLDLSAMPLLQHNRSTNRRLKRWIDTFFPARNIVYLQDNRS